MMKKRDRNVVASKKEKAGTLKGEKSVGQKRKGGREKPRKKEGMQTKRKPTKKAKKA